MESSESAFYHARVTFEIKGQGGGYVAPALEYDLSHDEVIARCVVPYVNDAPISLDGKRLPIDHSPKHVRMLTIRRTDTTAAEFGEPHRDEIRALYGRYGDNLDSRYLGMEYDIRQAVWTWAPEVLGNLQVESAASTPIVGKRTSNSSIDHKKVFIVHGRDPLPIEQVSNFLQKVGLQPIVLSDQASRGQSIMAKLAAHTDVGFAVVILSSDDVGGLKSDPPALSPRARQNVIFELGYLIGKLGGDKVCPILAPEIEKPSDIDGIVYIPLDAQKHWRSELAREMDAAGIVFEHAAVWR